MHNYCINKLLNLKEVKVKNIVHADKLRATVPLKYVAVQ